MSVSSANSRLTLAAFLLLAPMAAGAEAPTSLLPAAPGAPLGPQAAPFSAPPPSVPLPEGVGARGDRIQVQDLAAPDINSTGLLDEAHGGFGRDMWAGSSLAVVSRVLPLLPAPLPWHSLGGLERRLLLTGAQPPAGRPAGGESFLKLRADRLWAMGDADSLAQLLKSAPDNIFTPELRHLQIDAALVTGDGQTACRQAGLLRQMAPADPYPAKVQVYCQFTSGKGNEAGLGVDLLREQKINDPAFFAAADALGGLGAGKLDVFTGASPLALAMAGAAKLPLPEAVVAGNPPAWTTRAVAAMPDATLEARLLAAEKAEAFGLMDTDALRRAFQEATFTTQELAQPLGGAATDKGVKSRALLLRAAIEQGQPAAKAEIITRALTLTSDGPGYFTSARLYAPLIAQMHPSAELAGFAAPAARALFAAGRPDLAAGWVALARSLAANGEQATNAAAGLWPLARLAATDGQPAAVPSGVLAAWRKTRVDLPPAAQQRRALIAFGLLAALGDKVSGDDWLMLFDGPQTTSTPVRPLIWHGLRVATEDLRQAETVLYALISVPDLTQADPTEIYRAVAALRLIGLERDARSLAIEAAVANGV